MISVPGPFTRAKEAALIVVEDDHTELWFIVADIRKEFPEASKNELQELTKRIVEELMANHGVKILDVETEWPLPLDSQQGGRMVDELFSKIKDLPDMGNGFWLGIPDPAPAGRHIGSTADTLRI
ncbi:hypothetical protein LGH70_14945 [Hymenobacter sp. BT635]|uniref:DUF1902 domain-containing protein n=1 Tax=Hymenobacter nitidus TaxID=2880929 RepID=A0ABS8AGW4_9BACT|nr:hypothetical protein [Hymenobacter nitidus]MCB2378897.1 hypothetical protein [Hymenobacter nitidus]